MARNGKQILMILLAGTLTIPATSLAGIKCWTNRDGVRECGNVVPPEYAQQETKTLNNRGVVLDVKARAKTPEEIEAEKEKKATEAEKAAEEKRKKDEQAAYDRMLLATFTTEQDLIASRDRKFSAMDATIEITRATIEGFKRKLNEMKSKAAQQERSGRPISDDLKEDMASMQKQIKEKEEYIEYSEREKEQLRAKYDADLKRYRELTSVKPR